MANNTSDENNQNDSQIEKNVRQINNEIKRKVTEKAKQKVKQQVKKIIKKLLKVLIKTIIKLLSSVALPVILVVIAAACIVIIIVKSAGTTAQAIGSEDYQILEAECINNYYKNGKIEISDEEVDKVIDTIKNNGKSIDDMGLTDDGQHEKDPKAQKRYYVRKFMIANLITKIVKIGDSDGNNIMGGILLQRHDAVKDEKTTLTYSTTLSDNTFTIDSSGNIQYLGKDGSTQTLSTDVLQSQEIPIMFFIDLALATKNPEYVDALANYIIDNSKNNKPYMTITILDTYVEQTTTVEMVSSAGVTSSVTTTVGSYTSSVLVTSLDGLLYKIEQPYTREEKTIGPEKSYLRIAEGLTEVDTITTKIDTFNQDQEVNPIIYDSQDEENNPFYASSVKKYRVPFDGVSKQGIGSMTDSAYILFKIMDDNLANNKLEQVLKYILYKWTGKNYGVTELDDSLFDINSFSSAFDGQLYGDTVAEQVWFALKDAGYSEYSISGIMGNMYAESSFMPGAVNSSSGAYGLCQWLGGRKTQLENYAYSQGKDKSDVAIQIKYLLAELTPGGNGIATYQVMTQSLFDNWKNAGNCTDATYNFYQFFERGGPSQYGGKLRPNAAQKYYDMFHGKEKPAGGGNFVADGSGYIIGHFTSHITGKTFTIYNQNEIPGWGSYCNRASSMSVVSGYKNISDSELIKITSKKSGLPNSAEYFQTYSNHQLSGIVFNITGNNGKYEDLTRKQLMSGGYIIIYINKPNWYGKSGQKWTHSAHWVAILDYDSSNNKIFVSDSGHRGSGWYNIDEFTSNGREAVDEYCLINP